MYFPKVRLYKTLSPYSRFSSSTIQKSKIGFVEHDIFSPEFKNVILGAQKTEDKLFIYLSTGPKSILPIVRHDRSALLQTVSDVYKVFELLSSYIILFQYIECLFRNVMKSFIMINYFQLNLNSSFCSLI
jgi:hypothetical protein